MDIWVLLSIWTTTCCVTLGKIFTLSGLQFPLLQKQSRVCSCHNLVCSQNSGGEGRCLKFKFLGPTHGGFIVERVYF